MTERKYQYLSALDPDFIAKVDQLKANGWTGASMGAFITIWHKDFAVERIQALREGIKGQ